MASIKGKTSGNRTTMRSGAQAAAEEGTSVRVAPPTSPPPVLNKPVAPPPGPKPAHGGVFIAPVERSGGTADFRHG